ncbi:MAG TPA: DUF3014 domain-containing protein [Caldimonas sp.]|jgi:hypothetical protein|nr:DUF3014 domain-containing protein [Caldimonas sp.]HEX2542023.1 DUF3014 domain-containing protein [Caldimonas sp.]
MKNGRWPAVAALIVIVAGAAALWSWQRRTPPAIPPIAEQPPSTALPQAPSLPPAASAVRYPIDVAAPASSASDPSSVLMDLFGRRTLLSMFHLDDFPRRFAATLDNLGRSSAPAGVWPVMAPAGRFLTEQSNGGEIISADNSLRYTPFVLLVETVDMAQAVDAYRRLYPLLQRAYEDLGYPSRYLNDRVIEVIDLLLATPSLDAPAKVHLPTIKGPLRPERPWVTYQFDDPALESLAAGQKILLRMGPANQQRMKVKLAEIRRLLVDAKAGR